MRLDNMPYAVAIAYAIVAITTILISLSIIVLFFISEFKKDHRPLNAPFKTITPQRDRNAPKGAVPPPLRTVGLHCTQYDALVH